MCENRNPRFFVNVLKVNSHTRCNNGESESVNRGVI